jgi:hypothetical protein
MSLSDAREFLKQMTSDPALAKEEPVVHRLQLVDLAREKGFEIGRIPPGGAEQGVASS